MKTQTFAFCVTVVAIAMVGCEVGQSTSSTTGLNDTSTPLSGPSPISEKDRLKQEAWARATEGFNFNESTNRLEMEPLIGLDRNTIDELMLQGDDHLAFRPGNIDVFPNVKPVGSQIKRLIPENLS